jgi:hypothetical protein
MNGASSYGEWMGFDAVTGHQKGQENARDRGGRRSRGSTMLGELIDRRSKAFSMMSFFRGVGYVPKR